MSLRAGLILAVGGEVAVYLAALRIDPNESLNVVFPIGWVIGVVLVTLGHSDAIS